MRKVRKMTELVYQIRLKDTEQIICGHIKKADNFLKRFAGLMGKKRMTMDGLFLEHVSCIHTCFMRFPIGVIYLDRDMRVLAREHLNAWKVGRFVKGAAHVIEVKAGEERKFPEGVKLEIINK